MFGLSFAKLLVIVAVVIIVWRGLRILTAVRDAADQRARLAALRRERERERRAQTATDLVECPRCGTFIPSGTFCPSKEQCRYRPRAA